MVHRPHIARFAVDVAPNWPTRVGHHIVLSALFAVACVVTTWLKGPADSYWLISPAFATALIWGVGTLNRWRNGGPLGTFVATTISIGVIPPVVGVLIPGSGMSSTRGLAYLIQVGIAWAIWTKFGRVPAGVLRDDLARLGVGALLARIAVIPMTNSAMTAIDARKWMDLALSLGRGTATAFVFLALWAALRQPGPMLLPPTRRRQVAALIVATVAVYAISYFVLPNFFLQLTVSIWAGQVLSRRCASWHIIGSLILTAVATVEDWGRFAGTFTETVLLTYLWTVAVVCVPLLLVAMREDKARLVALSERRRLTAERHADLFGTVFSSSSDGLVVVDSQRRVLRINPAAAQLTADLPGGREALVGDLLPDGSRNELWEVLRDGTPRSYDLNIHDAADRGRTLLLRSFALQSDEDMAVLVLQDVSGERDAAASVRQFAQMAAHDLRNPLTAMSLSADLAGHVLSEEADTPAVVEARGLLDDIVNRGESAAALLDDLVGFALVDQAQPALERLDVGEIARSAFDSLGDEARHALDLDTSDAGPVVADRRLLRRALVNLLSNAVKYADPSRPPVVHVSCAEGADGWVWVRVEDNGLGIPAGLEQRIFDPFYRTPQHSRRASGSGLGLSIVQRVASAHGGCARAVRLDEGTRFELRLPAAPVTGPAGPVTSETSDMERAKLSV